VATRGSHKCLVTRRVSPSTSARGLPARLGSAAAAIPSVGALVPSLAESGIAPEMLEGHGCLDPLAVTVWPCTQTAVSVRQIGHRGQTEGLSKAGGGNMSTYGHAAAIVALRDTLGMAFEGRPHGFKARWQHSVVAIRRVPELLCLSLQPPVRQPNLVYTTQQEESSQKLRNWSQPSQGLYDEYAAWLICEPPSGCSRASI
jgi:hypothetical protein